MAKPGRDGNPLELQVARGHEKSGKSEAVIRNVREHPIDSWLHRKDPIIQGYQHRACEAFLKDWELASIGAARAVPLDLRVDGGRFASDLTSSQTDALGRVNDALSAIGGVNRQIVIAVIVGRLDLDTLGERMRAMGHRWPRKRFGGPRVCEALHELAAHYKFAEQRKSIVAP